MVMEQPTKVTLKNEANSPDFSTPLAS